MKRFMSSLWRKVYKSWILTMKHQNEVSIATVCEVQKYIAFYANNSLEII